MMALPDGYVACAYCNWAGPLTRYDRHFAERHGNLKSLVIANPDAIVTGNVVKPKKERKPRTPTETEQRFYNEFLTKVDARFEAVTFHMANGHAYRPDWVVFNKDGVMVECIEVKGGHKLGSYQRARLAFDQAKQEFRGPRWTWAEWNGDTKTWRVEA